MITGDIVIVSFPYADLVTFKTRPAVIINLVDDKFNDVIICSYKIYCISPPG